MLPGAFNLASGACKKPSREFPERYYATLVPAATSPCVCPRLGGTLLQGAALNHLGRFDLASLSQHSWVACLARAVRLHPLRRGACDDQPKRATHHRKPLDAKQKVLVMFEIRLTDNADWSDRGADRSD